MVGLSVFLLLLGAPSASSEANTSSLARDLQTTRREVNASQETKVISTTVPSSEHLPSDLAKHPQAPGAHSQPSTSASKYSDTTTEGTAPSKVNVVRTSQGKATATYNGQAKDALANGLNTTDDYPLSIVEHFFHHGFGHSSGLFPVAPTADNRSSAATPQNIEANPQRAHITTGPLSKKRVNLSSLPYIAREPYLTVLANDLDVDDKVVLYVSVAYKHRVSCRWYLNNQSFDEHDFIQNMDIKSYQSDNDTYYFRICHVEVNHLLKLPTSTGRYEFTCSVSVDYEEQLVNHVLAPALSDACPPAKCSHRNAACENGKCVCDESHPVRLDSVHTTCRTESSLEDPCHYGLQCLYTTQNSECVNQGWCACKSGYGRNIRYECNKKVGVNARCDSDSECKMFNASCILSHCTCVSHAIEENDHCVDIGLWFESLGGVGPRQPTTVLLLTLALLALLNELVAEG